MLRKLGIFLAATLIALIVFITGNLLSFLGIFEFANIFAIKSPVAQSAPDAAQEVSTKQLSARIDEAATYLDMESLYRYTQEDLDTATAAAIEALIAESGDKYAIYYSPDDFNEYNRMSEGEYAGIGVVLTTSGGLPMVMQVYEGSSAYAAGVKSGDTVVSIDGDTHAWTVEEVVEAIKVSAADGVTIVWQRGEEQIETTLTAGEVYIPTVVTHLIEKSDSQIGYIYLRRFNDQSGEELKAAIQSLEGSGAEAFVLDLRGNPGGYLTQAVDITSLFVASGDVVRIETRDGTRAEQVSGEVCTDKALVVLVDGNSASASELVAAALQDHERATIVGTVTYRKGTIQDIRRLSWGGALRFTIAHYMSPLGTPIDGVGVTPDICVNLHTNIDANTSPDPANSLLSPDYLYEQGKDSQLDTALIEAAAKIGSDG